MGKSVNRALAAGVLFAALIPALVGCSTARADSELEATLSGLTGVTGAYVWVTTSGFPTNRGLKVRLYLDKNPGDGLEDLIEEAFRTMWDYPAFEPTNGISVQIALAERPEVPRKAGGNDLIDLRAELRDPSWLDRLHIQVSRPTARMSHEAMTDLFGAWTGGD